MQLNLRAAIDAVRAWVRPPDLAQVPERLGAAAEMARDTLQLVSQGAETIGHALVGQLRDRFGRPDPRPAPTLAALRERFPQAGLPEQVIGTTIDVGLLHQTTASPDQLMAKVKAMGMNTVRLGAYWNEIQPHSGKDGHFERLDALLAAAERHGLKVILSVGAKGANWPEYHVPGWADPHAEKGAVLSDDARFRRDTLAFVRRVAEHVADHPAIAMWQVENEPLDPSGPEQFRIGPDMLASEIAALRKADGGRRPVLVNCWSAADRRDEIRAAFKLADAVGLDVYKTTDAPAIAELGGLSAYERTRGVPAYAMELARETGKPAMIAELQADDWGSYRANPKDLGALTEGLLDQGYRDFLFWRLRQNVENEGKGDFALTEAETRLSRRIDAAS